MASRWMSPAPKKCDMCGDVLVYFFVDGVTRRGQWAIMCRLCHEEQGMGVGTGRAQVYNLQTLEKVEG